MVFRNLTQQLLSMISPLPESTLTLLDGHLRHGKGVDVEDVMDLLSEVVKLFPSIVLFLDGIDELSEAHRVVVVKRLWNLIDTSGSTVIKVYISGREDATRLTKAPKIETFAIHINQESIGGDISRVVEHEVHNLINTGELIIGDPSLSEEIIIALIEGSKGM